MHRASCRIGIPAVDLRNIADYGIQERSSVAFGVRGAGGEYHTQPYRADGRTEADAWWTKGTTVHMLAMESPMCVTQAGPDAVRSGKQPCRRRWSCSPLRRASPSDFWCGRCFRLAMGWLRCCGMRSAKEAAKVSRRPGSRLSYARWEAWSSVYGLIFSKGRLRRLKRSWRRLRRRVLIAWKEREGRSSVFCCLSCSAVPSVPRRA